MRIRMIPAALLLAAAGLVEAALPIDTITVTAYRSPLPTQYTGSAVSIIDKRQIEDRQDTVIADALRATPGLSIARSGPVGAQTQIRMRGAEANHLLVLIDGIEANDLATNDEFSFEHLNTFDIERIEVVRGAQSALWGSDALAGVINIITRTPEEPFETSGFLEAGSFGTARGGARVGLKTQRASLMLSGSGFDTDGSNVAREGPEDDGYRNQSFQLNAAYDVSPVLNFELRGRYSDSTTEFDGIDSAVSGLPTDADNETDATQSYLLGKGEWVLFDGRWTQALRYALTETETDTRAEDLGTPERDYDAASVRGDKYAISYQSDIRTTAGDGTTPGDLLTLAVDHERQEFRQRGEIFDFFGSVFDPNQDESLHNTGYVAQYLAQFSPGLTLSAGVRHDDNSDFDDATSWRATASWRPLSLTTRLHGSYGTGQKAPTFVERYGFYPNQFIGNPDLEPEESRGWDLGVEQRWLDGRLVADITYFRADLDDEIDGLFCPPPDFVCTAINRPGESRRRGVEVTLDAEPAEQFQISLAYTYSDSRADDPNTADTTLAREVRRPLHSGSVNLNRSWLDKRFNVNVSAAYTGEREDDFFPPPFFFPAERVTLDSYMLLSLAARYRFTPQLAVIARIENALDEDYEDVYGFNTPGAGAYLGVRLGM
jgi:vitamin B12 transporter